MPALPKVVSDGPTHESPSLGKPWGAVEDLAGVPGAVGRRDGADAWLRADERAPGKGYDVLAGGGAAADEALRDQDAVAVTDAEDALVEESVVQRAQAESVVDLVGPVERPPAHVRGLQPDRHRADAPVVAAEGALVLVRRQHQLPHPPVTLSARRREPPGLHCLQLQADSSAKFLMEWGREVQVEEHPRHPAEQRRLPLERHPQCPRAGRGSKSSSTTCGFLFQVKRPSLRRFIPYRLVIMGASGGLMNGMGVLVHKRNFVGAAVVAALLIGGQAQAQSVSGREGSDTLRLAPGRKVFDRHGFYELELPAGVKKFTVVVVGGGGGGGGGGVYSANYGTGGGGGGGGAAGIAGCTVDRRQRDIGKIGVRVGGGGAGGWQGGASWKPGPNETDTRPAPGGGGGGGAKSAVFVDVDGKGASTLAALAGGGGGGGGGGGFERGVGPRTGWDGGHGEGGGGGPRDHGGVGGQGGAATWDDGKGREVGGKGGAGGGYLCAKLGGKNGWGFDISDVGAVSGMAGNGSKLTAGNAGERGTFPTLPADIPAQVGQGAAGGSGGEHNTGGTNGGTGYVVITW